ncbi:MAG: LamG domain-containing protein, partial [Woeseiaceae bacterium]
PNFGGFLAAQQVGIAQLAVEYCNALINDTAKRATFFPGFSFNAPANTAFATTAGRDLLIDPLVDAVVGTNLASQPDRANIKGELNNLIDRLSVCGAGCSSDRTETIGIAVCSATLGSATMLVQ